jgi:lipopolysaccharide exporter
VSDQADAEPSVGQAPIAASAAKGFAWSAVSYGGNKFIAFLTTIFLARLIAPSEFGVFAAVLTIILYFEVILDLGIGAAVVYEQEDGITERTETAFTTNLLFASFLTVIVFLAAPWIADFLDIADDAIVVRMMAFYLLIRGFGQINTAMLRRDLNFKPLAAVELSGVVIRGVLSLGLAAAGFGVWAIVWGFLGGELASTVASWIVVKVRPRLRIVGHAARSMLKFGASVTLLAFLNELALNSDYLVVARQLGATALGIYAMAYRLPELLVKSPMWLFSRVAFPVYSKSRTQGLDVMRTGMLRALRLATLYGFAVGVGLALVSRDSVDVLFGAEWAAAATPMAVLALSSGIGTIGFASGDIFPAVGRPGMLVRINAPLTIVRVAGFIIAAPYGLVAIAWVHLVTTILYSIVRLMIAGRFLDSKFRESLRAMRPSFIVALLITVFALPVRLTLPTGFVGMLLIILAGCIGGALGLYLTRSETVVELRALLKLVRQEPTADADGDADKQESAVEPATSEGDVAEEQDRHVPVIAGRLEARHERQKTQSRRDAE